MSLDLSLLPAILVAGFAVTYVWRMLGAAAVASLDPEGEILLWVRAVATALVAALVAKIVLFPEGLLAGTLPASRLGSIAVGIGAFLWRRHVEASVLATIAAFLAIEAAARTIF